MKVKCLELKGFRGFDEIVLDFDTTPQRPTVFIGNNGVGKSSILDSLAIFLSSFITKVKYVIDPDNQQYIVDEETGTKIPFSNGNRFDVGDFKNGYDTILGAITVDSYSEELVWSLSGGKSKKSNLSTHRDTRQITKFLTKENINKIQENLPVIIYYLVNRSIIHIFLESQDDISTIPIDTYNNFLDQEFLNFKDFFGWFRNTEDLENENRRENLDHEDKKLKAVRNAIYSLIPEFDDLRVRRSPLRMTVNKTIGDKAEELSINQLSDGEKCLLAMVGDIARRLAIANPSLDDPLQGEGIVLIDEIELHLHPQWQHKIIPRLTETFPNCQFIVTTHSPQVLSHVQPENIYILQSTPDGIIASHPESSYGRDSNQILEDYMGTPERPQDIKDKILEIFQVIDQNDLGQAKKLCESLGSEIGSDEPELIRARAVIKRKEILGK